VAVVAPDSTSSPERKTFAEDLGSRASRWMRRAGYVTAIFVKFGFASIMHSVGLDRFLRRQDKQDGKVDAATAGLEMAVRLRLAVEEIGATAIKIGQVLSTRPDLVPQEYIQELRKLQEEVPPFPFEQAKAVIEAELGTPLEELFVEFAPEPLGSASLSQVHAAKLPSGEQVAVKVQRPGVVELVETDLAVMRWGARQARRHSKWAQDHDLVGWADEIAHILRNELDFAREGHNAERMRENLADEPRAVVPRVVEEYTASRVLTSQLIVGVSINNEEELAQLKVDRAEVAKAFAEIMLRQVIDDGFFHADPHAGNLKIMPDGRIAFFDFGHVGTAGPQLRSSMLQMLSALLAGDTNEMVNVITSIGVISDKTDLQRLRLDIDKELSRYWGLSAGRVVMSELFDDLMGLLLTHDVRMPPAWISLLRAMTIAEGICLQLDPEFDFDALAADAAQRSLLRRLMPRAILDELGSFSRELSHYVVRLPRQLSELLLRAQVNGLKMRVELEQTDRPLHQFSTMANRLAFSIIVAAVIIAAAMILTSEQAVSTVGSPVAITFIIVGAVMGVWLLYSIIRSGRL